MAQTIMTPDELLALVGRPKWDLDPPQREDYGSEDDYEEALREYARRVMCSDVMDV